MISSGDYEGGDIIISALTVCWKLELLGSQEMTAEVEVMLAALTQEGPRGASFPMIMVQAASLEVLRLIVTDLTLIR